MIELKCIKFRVRIFVEQEDDRYYAYCPELKGVHEDGYTKDDAIDNAKESALVYIQSMLEHNDPLPLCVEEVDMSFSAFFERTKKAFLPKSKPTIRYEDLDLSDLSLAT